MQDRSSSAATQLKTYDVLLPAAPPVTGTPGLLPRQHLK
jgi:hypothetical protein